MEKRYTFATLFFNIENFHLIKDPGMIPYTFKNTFDYNVILLLWNNREYTYVEKYFNNIEIVRLEWHDDEKERRKETLNWIRKNAYRVDILHLYFADDWTFKYIKEYKKYNKKGLIYAHMDSNGLSLKNRYCFNHRIKRTIKREYMKAFVYPKTIEKDVLWGIQTSAGKDMLNNEWPFTNLMCVPNGFHWDNNIPYKPFKERDNVVLTVARNGTTPKKTDILMNGFADIADEFPDWKLVLVGTIEESFKPFVNDYYKKHPKLRERVVFIGEVQDRDRLHMIYSSSKVFALTSGHEGFGLVTVEAMSGGCFVIESDIPANIDITMDGKYGCLFKNLSTEDFAKKLRSCLNNEDMMANISESAYERVNNYYSWNYVLQPVDKWIRKKLK